MEYRQLGRSGLRVSSAALGTMTLSHQIYSSLLDREAEYELVPLAIDEGLGILVWGPLAGGWLSGKYRRGEPLRAGTRQASPWGEPPIYDTSHLYDVIEGLVAVGREVGHTPPQVALAFLLARPGVTSVILGARDEAQLQENLKATSVRLDGGAVARLEALSAPGLLYPYWHQARTAADRLSAGDTSLLAPLRTPAGS